MCISNFRKLEASVDKILVHTVPTACPQDSHKVIHMIFYKFFQKSGTYPQSTKISIENIPSLG